MPNLVVEIQGRVVLLVHNRLVHAPEEWRTILALAARPDLEELRVLVHGEGGGIDTAQRRELIDTLGGRMPVAAVLTSNRIARAVTAAIGWFKPGIRAFPPEQFERAVRYLELTEKEVAFVSQTLPRLQAQIARKAS